MPDPDRRENSSLGAKDRRAIDIREHDRLDESAFEDLVRAAARVSSS